ncbi:MAG: azurin [Verrucomicrobiales bacterium]|jgi:azurin
MIKKLIRLCLVGAVAFGVSSVSADDPVTEITITTDKVTFLYDVKAFTAKAGTKVTITLINPKESAIPQGHNIVIVKPGTDGQLIAGALQLAADPQGLAKGYVPENADYIVSYTKMINAGEETVHEFTVPDEAGDYPYLCTFPGHFATMRGVLTVVK